MAEDGSKAPAQFDKGRFPEEDSESDTEASDVNTSDDEDSSWISWFCTLKGNEFLCEVDEDYIQDDFNLSGLASQVPYYEYALDLILDVESPNDEMMTEEQHEIIESSAEMLYGLIHARYILTSRGMNAVLDKYKNIHYGRCPRAYCCGQPCLPVGTSDIPRTSTVKTYCAKCCDIYYTRNKYQGNIDGAYFGTTFPHLFLMTFSYLKPPRPTQVYTPRIFGFRIHNPAGASMAAGALEGAKEGKVSGGAASAKAKVEEVDASGKGAGQQQQEPKAAAQA